MNKVAGTISDADVMAPFKAWMKAVPSPLASAVLLGAGAAGTAYLAGPWAFKKAYRTIGGSMPGATRRDIEDEIAEMDRDPSFARRLALLAGGGTFLAHMLQTTNFGRDAAGNPLMGPSMARWNYMPKESQENIGYYDSPGDSNALLNAPIIPLQHSKDLIWRDPYLNNRQKNVGTGVFEEAASGQSSGLISGGDIAKVLIRGGLGYAVGSFAGRTAANLFSLPPTATNALSRSGGIATALINTGIVGL